MRVLLISPKTQISNGGIAVWTDAFLRGADVRGLECDIVNTQTVGKRAENLTAGMSLFDEIKRTRSIMNQLSSHLSDKEYSAAHINTSIGKFGIIRDYFCARALKKKNIPIILHFHCDVEFWVKGFLVRHYLKRILKITDKCLVLNESSQKYLMDNFTVHSEIIPNFIDDGAVISEHKNVNEKIEKVFFVGRLTADKGIKELISVANCHPDIVFELAGELSEGETPNEFPKNIHLLGRLSHEEVIERMDGADLFLFPSHSEGFSLSLLESMARGLPAIATDVGANASMLAEGAGNIVAVGDVSAINEALSLMSEQSVREDISKKAVDRVKTLYAESAFFDRILPIYEALIK